MKNESDPFYLGVIHRPRSKIWFKTSKLGERSLRSVMRNMADAVELLGKKVSNHSARRTCITTLRQENIDNLKIAGLSGNCNLLSLDNYSSISEEQQREMAYMISKQLGQSGQQPGVCSALGHSRNESICQPLQNISRPRPNSNLSNEMSTYCQSFPSFAASNDDIPTGLFARATFQNCTFTFGSSCGMNSVSDPSSSSTSWKRALPDSTPPCGKFQKKRYILESDSSDVIITIEL